MRISSVVVYQQIRQLIWHLLVFFGLVMVLPLEEAVMSFRDDAGFSSQYMWGFSIAFSPLLMGLIGCANVQADLNEKRYIFWRSKPASTKLFITVKYFVGLVAGLLIMICPAAFAFISCRLNSCNVFGSDNAEVLFYVLLGILTYSLCFCVNVLIRRSARAWLVGMVASCFVLVSPFVLPLGYKDYRIDVLASISAFYISLIIVVSIAAFVFSLFAAERDWHLKTNLKRLLWAGFGLVFVVMMFFSSQVANIRVLQEKEIEYCRPEGFSNIDGKILFQGQGYVDIDRDNISFKESFESPSGIMHDKFRAESRAGKRYRRILYPRYSGLYQKIGGELYLFYMQASGWGVDAYTNYEKVHLVSLKLVDNRWKEACELDLSDCLKVESGEPVRGVRMAMRYIDNKILACINAGYMASSCVIDVSCPSQLKLIEKKPFLLERMQFLDNQERLTSIPLFSVDGIDIKERIRLSIDLYYEIFINDYGGHRASIVDIDGDRISFFCVSEKGIKRYDVTDWDDENVYCKVGVKRSFTILERLLGSWFNHVFVKNGKLYVYDDHRLMVFDIRSVGWMRKLGHFVRADFRIEDIIVLEDGDILMSLQCDYRFGGREVDKSYLYLLRGP